MLVGNMWPLFIKRVWCNKRRNRYHVYETAEGFCGAQDGNNSGTEHVVFCSWLRSHAASLDSSSLPYTTAHIAQGGLLTSLAPAPIFLHPAYF